MNAAQSKRRQQRNKQDKDRSARVNGKAESSMQSIATANGRSITLAEQPGRMLQTTSKQTRAAEDGRLPLLNQVAAPVFHCPNIGEKNQKPHTSR